MISHILWSLQKAIIHLLESNPVLVKKIQNRIFDIAPPLPVFPYIVLGEDKIQSWNSKTTKGHECFFVIHLFSRDKGRKEVKNLIVLVDQCFQNESLLLDDHQIIHLLLEQVQTYVEPDQVTSHAIMRYKVLTTCLE